MTRVFLAIWLAFFSSALRAETVTVQSGEHEDFSRLVFLSSEMPDWELGRVEGGFELRSGRPDIEFDLGRVFDLIPRDRVREMINRENGRVFLDSSCACHVDAFELSSGFVVVDVKDGPASERAKAFNANFEESQPKPDEPIDAARQVLPVVPARPVAKTAQGFPTVFGRPTATTPIEKSSENAVETSDKMDVSRAEPEAVSELEQTLLEQISRAATQGLLEADLPDVQESVAEVDDIRTPVPDDVPMDVPAMQKEPETHFAISTAIDRARQDTSIATKSTGDGRKCLPSRFFEIEEWGVPLEEGSDVGAFRAGLISEYDTTDAAGATALVRHYIYITFGAEARALLRYYRDLIDRPDVLDAMAQIMDDGYAENAEFFVDQMACEGAVALWATLAQPQLFKYQEINAEAVVFEFLKLPPHLRRLLGPGLVKDFLAIDDPSSANALKASVDRVLTDLDENAGMMEAEVALSEGDQEGAARSLDGVIEVADARLPEALLSRAALIAQTGEDVPDAFTSLLESVAYENKGSETEYELRAAAIMMRVLEQDTLAAFARYDALVSEFGSEMPKTGELRETLFAALADNTKDYDFLTTLIARMPDAILLSPDQRRTQASRALDLGFPELSKQLLASANVPQEGERVVLAQALLQQRRPEVALGYLAGLDTKPALSLKAEALRQMGDHVSAASIFEQLGETEQQLEESWRGGQWEPVAEKGEGVTRAASQMMIGEQTAETGSDVTPLAANEALVANSKENRRTVEALLEKYDSVDSSPQ
ncbi:MAG: hypothetical protein ACRBCL_13965 [Maritimibacter sp.]